MTLREFLQDIDLDKYDVEYSPTNTKLSSPLLPPEPRVPDTKKRSAIRLIAHSNITYLAKKESDAEKVLQLCYETLSNFHEKLEALLSGVSDQSLRNSDNLQLFEESRDDFETNELLIPYLERGLADLENYDEERYEHYATKIFVLLKRISIEFRTHLLKLSGGQMIDSKNFKPSYYTRLVEDLVTDEDDFFEQSYLRLKETAQNKLKVNAKENHFTKWQQNIRDNLGFKASAHHIDMVVAGGIALPSLFMFIDKTMHEVLHMLTDDRDAIRMLSEIRNHYIPSVINEEISLDERRERRISAVSFSEHTKTLSMRHNEHVIDKLIHIEEAISFWIERYENYETTKGEDNTDYEKHGHYIMLTKLLPKAKEFRKHIINEYIKAMIGSFREYHLLAIHGASTYMREMVVTDMANAKAAIERYRFVAKEISEKQNAIPELWSPLPKYKVAHKKFHEYLKKLLSTLTTLEHVAPQQFNYHKDDLLRVPIEPLFDKNYKHFKQLEKSLHRIIAINENELGSLAKDEMMQPLYILHNTIKQAKADMVFEERAGNPLPAQAPLPKSSSKKKRAKVFSKKSLRASRR